jgi:hypothetical protein
MPIKLSAANEKSSYFVTVSFTDEEGQAVTPDTLIWTLTDSNGNVVNDREDVEITPDTSVTIVLSGDDLPHAPYPGSLYLLVEATYTSSLGSDLPLVDEAEIPVTNLAAKQ